MLELKEITKDYVTGGETVHALKGINIKFRDSEFVSVLGPSGCGKTTTLNIIGGLDRFTGGDLIINGRSTKDYSDKDWDTYRNHSIGFVFQSYNLIPHQTVLSNVELALTLSGVSKTERRKRAKEALEKVGLGDQLKKKPSQMSGGQMQRVAIARALVNDPDILLADEPTGALDTETSIQIMDILKEISKEKLIIMVTHNPEIAEKYSTRIVSLIDGKITGDTDPVTDDYAPPEKKPGDGKEKKTTMSFGTALSLSMNNLLTKKGRTFLTSFAGSIGIIGIALILSISNGIQLYINRVQEDTLSSYPLTIQQETADMSAIIESMSDKQDEITDHPMDKIYSNNIMNSMMTTMVDRVQTNNLTDFMKFLEDDSNGLSEYISNIQYTYSVPIYIYKRETDTGVIRINPSAMFQGMMGDSGAASMMDSSMMAQMSSMSGMDVWTEMLDNDTLLESQYDMVAGRWAEDYDEVMLIVNGNNEITDYALYSLGILDLNEIPDIMQKAVEGEVEEKEQTSYTYDELLDISFSLVLPTDYYRYNEDKGIWEDMTEDEDYMKELVENAPEIKITGIIRPNEEAVATAISGAVGYTHELAEYVVSSINDSDIVKQQKENPDVDVFTGIEFSDGEEPEVPEYTMEDIEEYVAGLPEEQQAQFQQYQQFASMMSEEQIIEMFSEMMTPPTTDATYDENISKLCVTALDTPSSINIYASTFENKDMITDAINSYNSRAEAEGREGDVIHYTDYVGLLMSSVTTIVNAISYVLIAFVSISLIVSSIMIGIITYISVLERTKEIGILRSIGASKKDISRVFNAETLIVGFTSGLLGILVTVILNIPISIIVKDLTDISGIAQLPPVAGLILVIISMLLTVIAGLIPSGLAAKKDPVIALRSE